jgi:hypothetical protein
MNKLFALFMCHPHVCCAHVRVRFAAGHYVTSSGLGAPGRTTLFHTNYVCGLCQLKSEKVRLFSIYFFIQFTS